MKDLLTQIELIFSENLDGVKFLIQRWLKIRNAQELLEIEHEIHDYFRKFADSFLIALIIAVISSVEYQKKTLDTYRSWPNPMRSAGRRNVKVNLLGGSSFTIRTPYFVPDRRGQRGRPRGIGLRGKGKAGVYPLLDALGIRDRRNKKTRHRKFKARWREPKLLTIYIIDEDGRKDDSFKPVCDGTFGDSDAIYEMLISYLKLLGAKDAEQLVIIGDGARWIWNRIDTLIESVGISSPKVTPIVDFYHAVEHLHTAANLKSGWSAKERNKWLREQKKLLRRGNIENLLEAFSPLLKGRNSKKIRTEYNYFSNNREMMRYLKFEKMGLPIGSGAIESAIRRIVNLRMKGNGIFWLEESAEGMLHLRSYIKSGRWDELVKRTIYFQVDNKVNIPKVGLKKAA